MTPIADSEISDVDFNKLLEQQAKQAAIPAEKTDDPKKHKMEVLRAKVKVVARMNRIFKTLR